MDPAACVRRILSALATLDHEEAAIGCDDLRAWCRKGGLRPYGWSSDECAAFVTAAMNMAHTLSL